MKSTRNWEKALTEAERKTLARMDERIAKLADELSILRMRRLKIQNRASVRAGKK